MTDTHTPLHPLADRHPATTGLLAHFRFAHLPHHLAAISKPVCELAHDLALTLPDSAELSVGLRKLLEAKDCLVRAAVDAHAAELRP